MDKRENYPKNKFGQNFLEDKGVVNKIIKSINCKDKQLSRSLICDHVLRSF